MGIISWVGMILKVDAGVQAGAVAGVDVTGGQFSNKQAKAWKPIVATFTSSAVKSLKPASRSETTTPGKLPRSSMSPLSMSLNTLSASVTAASAAPLISVGSFRA